MADTQANYTFESLDGAPDVDPAEAVFAAEDDAGNARAPEQDAAKTATREYDYVLDDGEPEHEADPAAGEDSAQTQPQTQAGTPTHTDTERAARDADIDRALAERAEAERAAELQSLRDEIRALREHDAQSQAQTAAAEIDRQIGDAQRAMAQAQEEGDTERAAAQQQKLVELHVAKATRAANPEAAREPERDSGAPAPNNAPAPAVSPAAQQWLTRNAWFTSGVNPRAAQTALTIENRLRAAGYDPNAQAMYTEIDRQIGRYHPEVAAAAAATDKPKQGPARGRASAPTNGMGAQAAAPRNGKIRITEADRRQMRAVGLDPGNKDHLSAWAAELRAESRAEANT